VGKPKERDFISFRKDISATKLQFPAREIHLQHPNFALENVPSLHCCTTHPENNTLENVPIVSCMAQLQQEKPSKQPRFSCLALKFVLSFSCCTDLYSMTSNNSDKYQHTHTEICLGKCAQFPLGNAPSLLPTFPSQALLKIFQSPLLLLSCILPNAFSYNSKMTFHLPHP
jgi:hypothetical protein